MEIIGLLVNTINGFTPNNGDSFLLIDNRGRNPIFGRFAGLDHGEIYKSMSHLFLVSYQAGSNGRGFSLTAVLELSSGFLLLFVACHATCNRCRS